MHLKLAGIKTGLFAGRVDEVLHQPQSALRVKGALGVGHGHDAGPLRGAQAGAAHAVPGNAGLPEGDDGHVLTRGGVCVERHIGHAAKQ